MSFLRKEESRQYGLFLLSGSRLRGNDTPHLANQLVGQPFHSLRRGKWLHSAKVLPYRLGRFVLDASVGGVPKPEEGILPGCRRKEKLGQTAEEIAGLERLIPLGLFRTGS